MKPLGQTTAWPDQRHYITARRPVSLYTLPITSLINRRYAQYWTHCPLNTAPPNNKQTSDTTNHTASRPTKQTPNNSRYGNEHLHPHKTHKPQNRQSTKTLREKQPTSQQHSRTQKDKTAELNKNQKAGHPERDPVLP